MKNEIPCSGEAHAIPVIEGAGKQHQMLDIIAIHDLMTSLEVVIFPEPSLQRSGTEEQAPGDLVHEGGLALGLSVPFSPLPLPLSCWPFAL